MPFSFCIITKNEKTNIEKCIEALLPCKQEIIVVDTGSSDGTVEYLRAIADKEENVKIFYFDWIDDFAAAKNFSISKATNEFVFVIDSDEFIENIDILQIESLISKNPTLVGRINRKNFVTFNEIKQEYTEWINRIFSKRLYHYSGRIHEQIVAYNGDSYECYRAPVVVLHNGYNLCKEQLAAKAGRNINLLNKELEYLLKCIDCEDISELEGIKPEAGSVEEQIPYILYQLGKSYYMLEDYEKAIEYFSRGLFFDLNPRLDYVIDMVETYGYAMLNSGKVREALSLEGVYHEFESADFHFLMGLIYMNNAMFDRSVDEFCKATEFFEARMVGVNSFAALYNIGVIYECIGDIDEALSWYRKCGEYPPAKARISDITLA